MRCHEDMPALWDLAMVVCIHSCSAANRRLPRHTGCAHCGWPQHFVPPLPCSADQPPTLAHYLLFRCHASVSCFKCHYMVSTRWVAALAC